MPHIYLEKVHDFESINYGNLMQKRIRKVLLICSSYDAFILEEDGRIDSQINREYLDMNLSNPPSFMKVSSAEEAMEILKTDDSFDFILTMYDIGEIDVFTFTRLVKERYPGIPTVLLSNYSKEISRRIQDEDKSSLDYIFFWHGNVDLIMAIIKLIEDRMNADRDILEVGVQSILLVEDNIRYYSTYLPAIYKLVLLQSSEFLSEALNEQQQVLSKRARPKILFATNYNDAVGLYERYKDNLLGVISDVGFVIDKRDPSENEKFDAGIDLCKLIKKDKPLMPFLLQSSQESMRETAKELGVDFIVKYSKNLLEELSGYINREFYFGDFVFKNPDTGREIGRASNLREFQDMLAVVPDNVLMYHSSQNHMSKWLFACGLFSIARKIEALDCKDFSSPEEIRTTLIRAIMDFRSASGQGVVAKFDQDIYDEYIWFARMGEGSLGGKARGLAFINSMIHRFNLYDKYDTVRILIPRTVVVATDYFDDFIAENGLQYVINSDLSDDELLSEFVSSRLPEKLVDDLRIFIRTARRPLAIRSSSKLEDSHYQPFAGIYSTYMIPLTENEDQMLRLVGKAIKSVYASVFFSASRAYITATSNLLSDEKMAVVIQEVCGTEDQGYFFPTISGVARSLNFYPIGDEKPEDGIANIAIGLGKLVVEGGITLRFSPRYPKNLLQLSSTESTLRETQREMYVLSLKPEEFKTSIDDAVNLKKIEIWKAGHFRNMKYVSSTYDMQYNQISDSNLSEGRKIVTFAQILKYDSFPLAEILSELLTMGQEEMKSPVEIEFAINMDVPYGQERVFNILQIRPIVESSGTGSINWDDIDEKKSIIYAKSALGLGLIEDVSDIIYVKPEVFDSVNTQVIAEELNILNTKMRDRNENYILIGPGRWGSSDPWLGIPVKWSQISEARVIVESGLENFHVEPSQGTHFFQNLTSFGVGYMTLNPFLGDGIYDVAKLNAMDAVEETGFIRHVKFDRPLYIYIDGRNSKGIIVEDE
ncbi:MAG: phosphoenolpyruvate synthase [Rikenellaceae bacterium]|nr:phosphoenolpyruvate synthase [Rikenellaceae bacterium]